MHRATSAKAHWPKPQAFGRPPVRKSAAHGTRQPTLAQDSQIPHEMEHRIIHEAESNQGSSSLSSVSAETSPREAQSHRRIPSSQATCAMNRLAVLRWALLAGFSLSMVSTGAADEGWHTVSVPFR